MRVTRVFVLMFVAASLSVAAAGAGENASLTEAVKRADHTAVRALLKQRVDVNAAGPDGSTALYWAVYGDDLATVDLLIEAGANVNASNRYGAVPLLLACTHGNAALVERLLKAGANVNAFSVGETPLMTAARTGSVEVAKVLLAHGAEVDTKEPARGQTALMAAAAEKHAPMVRLLLDHGADVNLRSKGGGWSALLFAVRAGGLDAVHHLVEAGADVNQTLRANVSLDTGVTTRATAVESVATPTLMLAILNGHYEVAVFLLDQGADPNVDTAGRTALHALMQIRSWDGASNAPVLPSGKLDGLDVLKALLAHGADPNAGMTKEVPLAFYRGASQFYAISVVGATPFWLAARGADLEAMRVLLASGADPLRATKENTTPLMVAAGVGYMDGQTPGSERDALEAVKLILEHGPDINAANGPACVTGIGYRTDKDATQMRMDDQGREQQAYNPVCGWTALHGAASRGADSIVRLLVEKGAKLDVRDRLNQTPLNLAEGHILWFSPYIRPSTAELLRKLGGGAEH